jgi:hypothetical protein
MIFKPAFFPSGFLEAGHKIKKKFRIIQSSFY